MHACLARSAAVRQSVRQSQTPQSKAIVMDALQLVTPSVGCQYAVFLINCVYVNQQLPSPYSHITSMYISRLLRLLSTRHEIADKEVKRPADKTLGTGRAKRSGLFAGGDVCELADGGRRVAGHQHILSDRLEHHGPRRNPSPPPHLDVPCGIQPPPMGQELGACPVTLHVLIWCRTAPCPGQDLPMMVLCWLDMRHAQPPAGWISFWHRIICTLPVCESTGQHKTGQAARRNEVVVKELSLGPT